MARYVLASEIMKHNGGTSPAGHICHQGDRLVSHWSPHDSVHGALGAPFWRLGLVVGFLGGYTTFSSFKYETFKATRQGSKGTASLNGTRSVVLGYIAVWPGAIGASRR